MLEVRNLSRIYKPKKGVPVKALDNVSMKIEEKGMVFVLGKSGSGKSTFLNLLGGLDKADNGEILIMGKSSKDFSQSDFDSYRNTYIGFIFQEYNILEEFTVGQNIALALQLQGKKATNEEIGKILDEVDLVGYANRKPNELSGGQLQRVAIARALIKNPQIIMADEPTGALDSKTGIQVFDTLKKLSKNKLVLIVSHDRDFAERYADRIIEFSDGNIISDVVKYQAHSSNTSGNVNVIDNKILHIKKGDPLSQKELDMVVEYLKNNRKDDTLISFEKRTNDEMKNFAHIDKEGNKESFKQTKADELEIRNYNSDDYKKIKSRLPYKNSLKIGASSLKTKPFRLIMTILLSVVAFTLFGLITTFANFNKTDMLVDTTFDNNIEYLNVQKKTDIKVTNKISFSLPDKMDSGDFELLKKNSNQTNFLAAKYQNNIELSGYNETKLGSHYFVDNPFGAMIECDLSLDEMKNNYNLEINGNLPQNIDEIAITKYQAEYFKIGGYYDADAKKTIDIFDSSDLIGKFLSVKISDKVYQMKVVGIVDTKLNDANVQNYKTKESDKSVNTEDKVLMKTISSFKSDARLGFSTIMFASSGFYNHTNPNHDSYLSEGLKISNAINKDSYYSVPAYAKKLIQIDNSDVVYFDNQKASLGETEVLVPFSLLSQYFENGYYPNFMEYAENYDNVPQAFKDLPKEKLAELYGENTLPNDITDAIRKSVFFYWFSNTSLNDTVAGIDKVAIFDDFIAKTLRAYLDTNFQKENFENIYISMDEEGKEKTKLSIVGIYVPKSVDFEVAKIENGNFANILSNGETWIFADKILNDMNFKVNPTIDYALGKMFDKKTELKAYLTKLENLEFGDSKFDIQTNSSTDIATVSFVFKQLKTVFLYVGIALAFFAGLMLMNYISQSITNKKKEIGVLRAVGARGIDVYGIFFNEAIIIAIINFIISIFATYGTVVGVNSIIRSKLGLNLSVLHFGGLQVLLIIGISLLTATVASFLPVFKIARKRPIEAIRKR